MSAVTNSRGNANKSLDHAMSVSEQLHTYPSSNPTLTCHCSDADIDPITQTINLSGSLL